MPNWKYAEGSVPLEVLETIGVNGCPIISISVTGRARCHNHDGTCILVDSSFNLVKEHPCRILSPGDLVMVWNDDTKVENARTRKFQRVAINESVEVEDTTDKTFSAMYQHGLPYVDWVTRVLQS